MNVENLKRLGAHLGRQGGLCVLGGQHEMTASWYWYPRGWGLGIDTWTLAFARGPLIITLLQLGPLQLRCTRHKERRDGLERVSMTGHVYRDDGTVMSIKDRRNP